MKGRVGQYQTLQNLVDKINWRHASYISATERHGVHTQQHGASAADPIVGTLHDSAVAIASARFIPEILSTGNAIDVRF
jgi:hypothetical protein